jgi:hypothetical protein
VIIKLRQIEMLAAWLGYKGSYDCNLYRYSPLDRNLCHYNTAAILRHKHYAFKYVLVYVLLVHSSINLERDCRMFISGSVLHAVRKSFFFF